MNVDIINRFKMQWIKGVKAMFEANGWTVSVYETTAKRPKAKPTDLIIFMWCDEDAYQFISTQPPMCPYIVFVRRYEYYTTAIEMMPWDKIGAAVCVNDYMAYGFKERTGVKPHVIHNGIIPEDWTYKERGHGTSIACVGFVNQKKNLPLAMQILAKAPNTYSLHIAGGVQDGATVDYIMHMAKEIKRAITIYGHIENMDEWLEDKNYILSTAISEGSPNSVLEAIAKGIKPIVHNWPGAEDQFQRFVFNTVDEAISMIHPKSQYVSQSYRDIAEVVFGKNSYNALLQLAEQVVGNKPHTYHKLDSGIEFYSDDVDLWVVSYPKSGRTWLRLFLQGVMLHFYKEKYYLKGNLFYPASRGKPKVTFTHSHVNWKGGKTVFLMRDPRDVLVSSYFHNMYRSETIPKDMPISDYVRSEGGGIDIIIDFHRRWERRLTNMPHIVMRYEDLMEDDFTEFKTLLAFADIEMDGNEELFKMCVKGCRFETIRKHLTDGNAFEDHPEKYRYVAFDESNPQSHKFREGKVGGYKDYLSEKDIEYINDRMKNFPEKWRHYYVA